MPIKPPSHRLRTFAAPSHSRQVYDRQTRLHDPLLRQACAVRSSSFWKQVRLSFISRNPICANPHGFHSDFPPPSQEVHHVKSLQEAPDLAFSHANLMALCSRCHAVFSQQERK